MKPFLTILLTLATLTTFAQTEEEVMLETGEGTLAGVLTIPDDCEQCTVILMISGSGPNDRDGNSRMGVTGSPFKMFSDELVANNIATLRFDKYFSGKSRYEKPPTDVKIEHFINGFEAWLGLLLPDQRFGKLGVLGHSQGALIGSIITARQPEVDFYISLAGPGQSIDKTIIGQCAAQDATLGEEATAIFAALKNGETVSEVSQTMMGVLPPAAQVFYGSWAEYDPAELIKRIQKPTLILNGTEDIQVKESDAEMLGAAQPNAKVVLIKNMNHILKEVEEETTFAENYKTYSNPNLPLHKELVPTIISFLEE